MTPRTSRHPPTASRGNMYLQWSQRASGVAAFFDKPQIFIVNRPPSERSYSGFSPARVDVRLIGRLELLRRIVAWSRPRREQNEQARSVRASHRAALGRVELEQRPRRRGDRVRCGLDLHSAVENHDPCSLSHLALSELLTGGESDEHRPAVLRVEHDG